MTYYYTFFHSKYQLCLLKASLFVLLLRNDVYPYYKIEQKNNKNINSTKYKNDRIQKNYRQIVPSPRFSYI